MHTATRIQSKEEIEQFYATPDPWEYETNPHDQIRKEYLLKILPQRDYARTLDIGCGNGFLTRHLPGELVIGCDISEKAINWAKQRANEQAAAQGGGKLRFFAASLFDLPGKALGQFDLLITAGVLYRPYIGRSVALVQLILDRLLKTGGILVTCHIKEWDICPFPYMRLERQSYSYRNYVHLLEVYKK
jgi:SAM-dependent methyltransferase